MVACGGPRMGPIRTRAYRTFRARPMNNAMMMERTGMAGMGATGMGAGAMGAPTGMSGGMNMMMVPRCTMKMEKCDGGMKVTCTSDDKMSAGMMQNLCTMLAGGMCSCCMMRNGMMV